MTVSIPIQADPAGTINAIEAVRAAMRGIGEEGRALADIDFSKIMGTADMLRDLDRVQQNLRDIAQTRGETGANARRLLGDKPGFGALLGLEDTASRSFADPNTRRNFVRNVSAYSLRGTGFDPSGYGGEQFGPPPPAPPGPPTPPPPPPPPPPPAPFKLEDLGGSLMKGLMGGAGFFLAQAGLSSIASVAGQAMGAGEAENNGTDALLRRTGDLANSFDQLRNEADTFHKGLLASRIDMERYAGTFAQASGVTNIGEVMRATRLGVGAASGFGIDQGSMVQSMGRAAFLGVAPEKFAEMIGESAVRGSMGGRVEEVMGSLLRWTENASRVSATGRLLTGNLIDFTNLYTSMNASGSPMLRGANGEAIINQINSSITNGGGGGLAGQVEMQRAMMSGGITDPYEIQMRLAGGAFGRGPNGTGTSNFDLVQAQLHREYRRGSNQAAIAGGMLLGLNPLVYQQLDKMNLKNVDLAGLEKMLPGGLANINPSALPGIIRAQNANPEELKTMSWHLLHSSAGSHLTGPNAEALRNAGNPEIMRRALIAGLAQSGMPETDASRAVESTNKLTDELATMGRALAPALTALKENLASLADKATPLFEWARRQITPEAPSDPTDGVVKFSNPGSANGTFPGSNRDWGSVGAAGAGAGKRTVIAQSIGAMSGMLSRIGMQESGLGTTSGRIYGEIPKSFVADVREVAKTDDGVKAMIAGMSDLDIAALENLDNADLQRKAARNHLMKSDAYTNGTSMMARYASWNFGTDGNKIMAAPDGAHIGDILGAHGKGVPDYLKHMTVGEWKKAKSKLFPSDEESGGAGGGDRPISIAPSTLHIIIDPAKRALHSKVLEWVYTTEAPTPHGTKAPAAKASPAPVHGLSPHRYVDPATGQVIY